MAQASRASVVPKPLLGRLDGHAGLFVWIIVFHLSYGHGLYFQQRSTFISAFLRVSLTLHLAHLHLVDAQQMLLLLLQVHSTGPQAAVFVDVVTLGRRVLARAPRCPPPIQLPSH